MQWTDQQLEAMRAILFGWRDLSRGDISILCLNVREPGEVLTISGTAHAKFWQNLVKLGWAELLYSILDDNEIVGVKPLTYRLTDDGIYKLSRFLVAYDLLNMGACTPAIDTEMHLANIDKQRALQRTWRIEDAWPVLLLISLTVAALAYFDPMPFIRAPQAAYFTEHP